MASSTHLSATSSACETCHNFNTTQISALGVQNVNLCFHLSIFQVAYVTTCSILQSIGIHCFIISLLYSISETALWNGDMWRYLKCHDGTFAMSPAPAANESGPARAAHQNTGDKLQWNHRKKNSMPCFGALHTNLLSCPFSRHWKTLYNSMDMSTRYACSMDMSTRSACKQWSVNLVRAVSKSDVQQTNF